MVKGSMTRATTSKHNLIEILLAGETEKMLRQIDIDKGNDDVTKEDMIIGFIVY